jgi:hypothetical protein
MRKVIRYFFRQRRGLAHLPRQYIRSYDILEASIEETRLMKAGVARSPQEARRLFEHYQVQRAAELLPLLPSRQRSWKARVWRRFVWLVMKLEGARFRKRSTGNHDELLPISIQYEKENIV